MRLVGALIHSCEILRGHRNERQRQKSFVVVEEARPREPRASELHADRKEAEAGNDAAVEAPSGVDGRAEEEEHDEEEEDTAYDIDDLSTTSSPEGESRSTSAAGKSGVPHGLVDGASDDDADHRFAAERPHPPRLSSRHLSATKAVSRGEEGDRDDLRASLEDKRRERTISKPKRPASAPVTRFAMSSSGRKAEGKKAEDDRTPTADQSSFEGQRAFAVVGEGAFSLPLTLRVLTQRRPQTRAMPACQTMTRALVQ